MGKLEVQSQDKLTNPELWKLLRDHEVDILINKEEFSTLIRLINTKLLNKKEIHDLDMEGFNKFLIQFALFVF